MKTVTLKRALAAAVHRIVQSTELDIADIQMAGNALAQLITAETGVDCQLKLVMNRQALEAAIDSQEARHAVR